MTSEDLVRRLTDAKRQYYDTGTSDLTDDEYDALRDFVISQGIEVSNLTAPPKGTDWLVVRHLREMPSMVEAKREDLINLPEQSGFASLKYDGLALELQYDKCELVHAVLRGDGHEGEDVLYNARLMWAVPPRVQFDGPLAVYGEAVISWNNLKRLNELRADDRLQPYKSPRNAVALLRSKSVNRRHVPLLTFRAYDSYPRVGEQQQFNMKFISELTPDHIHPSKRFNPVEVAAVVVQEAWSRLHRLNAVRPELAYQLDGVVFRGRQTNTCWKLKFPAQSALTRVIKVEEQLGRTGVVSPVAYFEPVELCGATVVKASVHNAELVATKLTGLGPDAMIMVSRRGDVIPHIEEVLEASTTPWVPGLLCPSCSAEVVQDGSIRRCSADPSECSGTLTGLLVKYCREVGIDGIGPSVASAMISTKLVETPAHLYMLDPETLSELEMDGRVMGLATAERIVNSVQMKASLPWGTILGAVGIQGCAMSVMEAIAEAFRTPEELKEATEAGLSSVDGVGPTRAAAVLSYTKERWDEVIEPLLQVVKIEQLVGGRLEGKTFCITLGLKSGSRPEMEARIKRNGGKVKSSVSKKVDYLVCNFPNEGTEKLVRARELGVPVISEDQLVEMFGESPQDTASDHPTPAEAEF